MSHRHVKGLRWAQPCSRPASIPRSRPRGTKGQGLAYERAFAKALNATGLSGIAYGPWFEFIDDNGRGTCSPDLIVLGREEILIFECKRTEVPEAHSQLRSLYIPVVALAYRRPVSGIIVARHLAWDSRERCDVIADSLGAAIAAARGGALPVLHWLGGTAPLIPRKPDASRQAVDGGAHLA